MQVEAVQAQDSSRTGSPGLDQVTVVVVTRESAHCLQALTPLLSMCPNVIVSDNGSADGTAALARQMWPHAIVLNHGRNLGFGTANNRALARVQTPFAFLLNPDCEMRLDDLLSLLGHADEYPQAALLAPQLVGPSGKPELNYRWPQTFWEPAGPGATGPTCVGFVCGAAMLFRMAAFREVGFFDEQFFLYYEDDDLCLRLFNARIPILLLPEVKAIHHSRGSVRGAAPWLHEYARGYHHVQSKLLFATKYRSSTEAARLRRWLLVTTTLGLPLRALLFSPKLLARMWGRWRGLLAWRTHA